MKRFKIGLKRNIDTALFDFFIEKCRKEGKLSFSNNTLDRINLNKALKDYQKASTIDSTNSESYNYIGLINAQLGQYAAATDNLKKALQLDPNDCNVKNNLAVVYALQSQFDQAHELLKEANSTCSNQQDIKLNMKQFSEN